MNNFIRKQIEKINNGEDVTIWVDIDGTIADTPQSEYTCAEPDRNMIKLINWLYDKGCEIFIVTARGGKSGIDWKETTEHQLKNWGVKYDKLIIGYPKDLYIGDETLKPDEFLNVI